MYSCVQHLAKSSQSIGTGASTEVSRCEKGADPQAEVIIVCLLSLTPEVNQDRDSTL